MVIDTYIQLEDIMNPAERRQYILDYLAQTSTDEQLPPDRVERVVASFEALMNHPTPLCRDDDPLRQRRLCASLAYWEEVVRPASEAALASDRLTGDDLRVRLY